MTESTEGKPIKCRAAICWGIKQPITVETIEVAPPKRNEVRVRIVASGLCGSDIFTQTGNHCNWPFKFPCIPGHEGSGIIESIGEGVEDLKPGDHVLALYMPQCKNCFLCDCDLSNFCLNHNLIEHYYMDDGTSRFSLNGQTVYRSLSTTFTEYTVLSKDAVTKIDKKLPLEKVCLLACSIGTGYGAVINLAKMIPGTSCAIWGLGGVGAAVALGCRNRQPKKMIGIDINDDKFEMLKDFGFTEFINPNKLKEPVAEYLKKQGGVDYGFDCVGQPVVKQVFDSLSPYGTAVILGACDKEVPLDAGKIMSGQTIKSGFFGGMKGIDGAKLMVKEFEEGRIDLDKMISKTMGLDEIDEAFNLVLQGKVVKIVIKM